MVERISSFIRRFRANRTSLGDFLAGDIRTDDLREFNAELARRKRAFFTRNGVVVLEKACVVTVLFPDRTEVYLLAAENSWKRTVQSDDAVPGRNDRTPCPLIDDRALRAVLDGGRFVTHFVSRETARHNDRHRDGRYGILVDKRPYEQRRDADAG